MLESQRQKCQEILEKVTQRSVGRSKNTDKKKHLIEGGIGIIVVLRTIVLNRKFARYRHQIVLDAAVNARLFPGGYLLVCSVFRFSALLFGFNKLTQCTARQIGQTDMIDQFCHAGRCLPPPTNLNGVIRGKSSVTG